VITLAGLEGVLRTGLLNQESAPYPNWMPPSKVQESAQVSIPHTEKSTHNTFEFNDINHELQKPPGVFRIAVIGDSFIWGDGVPDEVIWSHQLEAKLRQEGYNVEVFHWGRNGWATRNQLLFLRSLKEKNLDYNIDLFLVGFVSNDLITTDNPIRPDFTWHTQPRWLATREYLPYTYEFVTAYTNRFLTKCCYPQYEYINWEQAMYTAENLQKYRPILQDFKTEIDSYGKPLVVVLTTNDANSRFKDLFEIVEGLLNEFHISYLNTYPIMAEKFATVNPRLLHASLTNTHPNEKVTSVIADSVIAYLKQHSLLPAKP
jgi:lysophospholipase L1-like esterase